MGKGPFKGNEMRILLHICCGPCATAVIEALKEGGHNVKGLFYNPNIHPYTEYERRLQALKKYAGDSGLDVIYKDQYEIEGFLRGVAFREVLRCRFCYHIRLLETAKVAKNEGCDLFTTTLLSSPYQDHNLIHEIGRSVSKEIGIPFHYQDFRPVYNRSIQLSKEFGLYRQSYCGCIYSEKERYYKRDVS
jgi:hypothetical protein